MRKVVSRSDMPPRTSLTPGAEAALEAIAASEFSVICGRNNSGKTFILRELYRRDHTSTLYVGPQRFEIFNALPVANRDAVRKQREQETMRPMLHNGSNTDGTPIRLQGALASLSNDERSRLMSLLDDLLGTQTSVQKADPDNELSSSYVSVDGFNLSFCSSGYRLVASVLSALFDSGFSRVLLEEPEMGLSPDVQTGLAGVLVDDERRRRLFPHLRSVVITTHSPIFIDRGRPSNNFSVRRSDYTIEIQQIDSFQELSRLQFFLLGNRFESLFLPSAILLVEGKTDYDYLSHVISRRFPNSAVSIMGCGSDTRVVETLNVAGRMLGEIRKSPYSDRIIVVLDGRHQSGLRSKIEGLGVPPENVVVWEENGIEHYYPQSILEQRFGRHDRLEIGDDVVSANGESAKKTELCEFVVKRLNGKEELPDELERKLLTRLKSLLY